MRPPHEPPRYVAFTSRDTQALLIDEDVGAIQQQHIGNRASILVMAEYLERHLCTEHKLRRSLFRVVPVDLAILRAVDAAETDAFRLSIVQEFDGVVVEKCYDRAGEIGSNDKREKSAKSKGKNPRASSTENLSLSCWTYVEQLQNAENVISRSLIFIPKDYTANGVLPVFPRLASRNRVSRMGIG